jgi:hypothetical protein
VKKAARDVAATAATKPSSARRIGKKNPEGRNSVRSAVTSKRGRSAQCEAPLMHQAALFRLIFFSSATAFLMVVAFLAGASACSFTLFCLASALACLAVNSCST